MVQKKIRKNQKLFEIKNLTVSIEKKVVLENIHLSLRAGEIHALMGPNGSGKSSLAFAILGHPSYKIQKGEIRFEGKKINQLAPEKRSRLGIFLSFQEPPEIGGVSLKVFLKTLTSLHKNHTENNWKEIFSSLGLSDPFLFRLLNEGFSGGEKKKSELLQFLATAPKFAIFDEIDSGLDTDSLQTVAKILKQAQENGAAILVISHTARLLRALKPKKIHIMTKKHIVGSMATSVLSEIEKNGYKKFFL